MRKFWQGVTLPILVASEDEHRARLHPQSKPDSQLAGRAKLVLKKGQGWTTHLKNRSPKSNQRGRLIPSHSTIRKTRRLIKHINRPWSCLSWRGISNGHACESSAGLLT